MNVRYVTSSSSSSAATTADNSEYHHPVRAERLRRKWTQKGLAGRTRLSSSTISHMEAGKHITVESASRVAAIFGVKVGEFFPEGQVVSYGRPPLSGGPTLRPGGFTLHPPTLSVTCPGCQMLMPFSGTCECTE